MAAKRSIYDSFFGDQEITVSTAKQKGIPIIEINPGDLHEFKNHPFRVEENDDFESLKESIKKYGILDPVIARKTKDGYEIISGHRRTRAAQSLGLETVPVLEVDYDDDLAQIFVVDANKSRPKFYHSELAFAFKMRYEAEKHRGRSVDGKEARTAENIGKDYGQSARNVYNYIKLTSMMQDLLYYVDKNKFKFSAAIEVADLSVDMQQLILDEYHESGHFPSVAQAKVIGEKRKFTKEWLSELMETEPATKGRRFSLSDLSQYFPKDYTDEQKVDKINELLMEWQNSLNAISM